MSERQALSLTYTPLESGNEESRWIRLEQTQATLPGPPSLGGTAEMLDRVYGIDPCEDGLGGGGEAAGDDPSAEEVEESLAILLDDAGLCRQGHWLAAVNVYRTHEQPGYELRSETATVERVDIVEESHQQVVDVNGPLIALERPYAGGLTGIPAGVGWTVRGGTVNLDRPVRDRLTLRYRTKYERVTLRVPTLRTPPSPTLPPQAGGGQGGGSEEYEPAAVVAFWGDIAAECELEPPEPESDEDREARESVCRKRRPEPSDPGECWKIVHHFERCNCSYKELDGWDTLEPAPCDGASSGSAVGYERHFVGFVHCDGEEDDLHDIEFYRRHCCKSPQTPSDLPRCRRSYREYRGGHEIENGPEHWKNIYGDNVSMIAVLPESGTCGEEITEWNVPQKNCCDDVIPMSPAPDNPTNIWPRGTYKIGVLDGKQGELIWSASGGIRFRDNGETTLRTSSRAVWITADDDVCPAPIINVDDGCFPVQMTFEGPDSEGPSLPEDMAVMPDTEFYLPVSGGVPHYMWMASGGLVLLGWNATGSTAYFRTRGRNDWCVESVEVVDQCGRSALCTVRNADTGRWEEQQEFDRCVLPCAPAVPQIDITTMNYRVNTFPRCGYYGLIYSEYPELCQTGNALTTQSVAAWMRRCIDQNAGSSSLFRTEYVDGLCKVYRRSSGQLYRTESYADSVRRLWRWICRT